MRTKQKIVQNIPVIECESSMSDTIEKESEKSNNSNTAEEIVKQKIHPLLFLLNIVWMLLCCHCSLYYIFAPRAEGQTKGKIAAVSLGLSIIVSVPTLYFLTTLKNIFKLAFLIDTIMVVTLSAVMAFVNLIVIFDKGGTWHYPVIQVGFSIEVFMYSLMVRVMLVNLKWTKWQIIVFKLHLMINCLMFFVSGVYFIYADFTYTSHKLVVFDRKVHEFMVLFIFTMFGWIYEFYSKTTDLDHTGDLRYIYKIKNMDETRSKKKEQIIKKRRESKDSIRLLEQSEIMKKAAKQYQLSRFANINVMQEELENQCSNFQ